MVTYCMNLLYNILEMTKLCKWRTDEWLPGVREDVGWKGSGCGYERATGGILVWMFCILTVSMSVS